MKELRISVAMAVYNGELFIEKQLDSILSQSRVPDEIIICDDSRNDKTYKAIQAIIAQYPEIIKYHKNETQMGVSKNFEQAISLSSGDIILLSDQDDIWDHDKIRSLTSLIQGASTPIGAFCNSSLVDSSLNPLGITHWDLRGGAKNKLMEYIGACKTKKVELFCRQVPIAGHNMAFNAKLKDLLLPFPDLPECHDTWIGLLIAVASGWGICGGCYTLFRQHDGNLSESGRRNQFQEALYSIKNNTFDWNAKLYGALIERLTERKCEVDASIMDMLTERREHSCNRAHMNVPFLKRLPLVAKEICSRRYFKYARGWKSIVQDLFLRSL